MNPPRQQDTGSEGEALRAGSRVRSAIAAHSIRPCGGAWLALQRGPQVLSLERSLNPDLRSLTLGALPSDRKPPRLHAVPPPSGWPGRQAFAVDGFVSVRKGESVMKVKQSSLILVPYADSTDGRVWMMRPDQAVRVLGRPGKGRRTDKGRSSSCAELQAWAESEMDVE